MTNLVDFSKKHEYYNNIYHETHPYASKDSRFYKKPKDDFNFNFRDNELKYNKGREIDITKKSIDNFKTFKESDIDQNKKTIQNKISYYLSNNIVPVRNPLTLGF
jgi:hypothetical protein